MEQSRDKKHSRISRHFFRNIYLLLLVNLLIKPLYILGIDAQVQNMLGENVYGLYFSLFNFCMLLQIVLDPGILNYNVQLVSKDNENAAAHFKSIAGVKIVLAVLYMMLIFLGAVILGYPSEYFSLLPGILFILILNSFVLYLRGHFSALGQYRMDVWLSGLDKALMIGIIGYCIYYRNSISLDQFISLQLCALLLSIIIIVFFLRRIMRLGLRIDLKAIIPIVKKTFPFAMVLLLMTLYTRVDGVMLERLIHDDAYSAGLYARSFRLLDAANMIGILFASLMLPMFSKLIDQREQLRKLVEEIVVLLFFICLMVSSVCWYYGENIMDLIYIENTGEHYRVFRYLLLGFIAMGLSNIFGCLFLAAEQLRQINVLYASGILVNISLNLLLIPERGAFGAVMATLVTQAFVFIGQLYLAVKVFELRASLRNLTGMLILSGAALLIFGLGRYQMQWHWICELLLISFLMIVLAFLCGFLRFSMVFRENREP